MFYWVKKVRKWIIYGNRQVTGRVDISGSKNSLLAILAAAIVTKSIVELENVAPLQDTYMMISILEKLNVRVIYDGKSKLIIDARNITNCSLDCIEMGKLRASYYLIGALLSLYNEAKALGPGGCKFANRPIDLHLLAFSKLGFNCYENDDMYYFKKEKKIERTIIFDKVSVGASVNAILASIRVKGKVTLVNVAQEPEIDDLIEFLSKCGANIKRVDNQIIIVGTKKLSGCKHRIMQDRIEAGTFLILGACLGNNLKIMYNDSVYLKSLIEVLLDMGVDVKVYKDSIIVNKAKEVKDCEIIFDCYPSIATDLQQPLSILMSKSVNKSVLKDNVYPSRYTQIEDLNKMGFIMEVKDNNLIVNHSNQTSGQSIRCKDLRGGASLIVAALMANGKSEISDIWHIERGYYDIVNKLKRIGARIYEEN